MIVCSKWKLVLLVAGASAALDVQSALPQSPIPSAPTPVLWRGLAPGSFGVGFRVIYATDYSRNWLLAPSPVHHRVREVARPIRITVWYPTNDGRAGGQPNAMLFERYLRYPVPAADADSAFRTMNALLERRDERAYRQGTFSGNDVLFQQLINTPTGAVADAAAAAGRFPVVAYSAGWNSLSPDNTVLAEFLASHGHVVVTVPQLPTVASSAELAVSAADLETQMRDIEYALGFVKTLPMVDGDRIALAGYSMGGVAGLWLMARHPGIAGLIALDPSFASVAWAPFASQSPGFDVRRLRTSMLILQSGNASARVGHSRQVIDSLHFTDRYVARVGVTTHGDFSDAPFIAASVGGYVAPDHSLASAVQGHREVALLSLAFLQQVLRGDSTALMPWVARDRLSATSDSATRLVRYPAADLPSVSDYTRVALRATPAGTAPSAQRTVAAVRALYDSTKRRYPTLEIADEAAVNSEGYRLLQQGNASTAIALFRLNTHAFPTSANGYDSLADGYLAAADTVGAIRAYRSSLRVLPRDRARNSTERAALQRNAESQLARLQRSSVPRRP